MTLYEQILELFPLVSYEQNRRENGHVVLTEEADRQEMTPLPMPDLWQMLF